MNPRRSRLVRGFLLVAVLVGIALGALGGCSDSHPASGTPPTAGTTPEAAPTAGADTVTVRVGSLPPIRVEVARTRAERAEGLSGRERLPPGTGMIFRYEAPSTGGYWMRDVNFPLSLAWVRQGRVIGTVEMTPCTTAPAEAPADCPVYEPPAPYDTVIEARAGTFAEVEPGTAVRVTRPSPTAPRGSTGR